MRWANGVRLDIYRLNDVYQVYNKEIMKNRALVDSYGTPATFYRNTALNNDGTFNPDTVKCYCWRDVTTGKSSYSQPDRDHFLCMGTGVLSGYQKYGYKEVVYAVPNLTRPSNTIVTGNRGSSISINNADLSAEIITEVIDISTARDVDYFLANDKVDLTQNRVEYFYSYNGTDWTQIDLEPFPENPLGRIKGNFNLVEDENQIQFKIVLRKRNHSSPSPLFNSIRFRFRDKYRYNEIDPGRFPEIDIPAFLTVREQAKERIGQGEYGWRTEFPIKYWTLPEVSITNSGVLIFQHGAYVGEKFVVDNLVRHTFGKEQQILRSEFETVYIRKNNDLLNIANYFI